MQGVDPLNPTLKASGTKLLKPPHDTPLSTYAFKFKLNRYKEAPVPFAFQAASRPAPAPAPGPTAGGLEPW